MRVLIMLVIVLVSGTALSEDGESHRLDVLEVITSEVDDLGVELEAELYGLSEAETRRVKILKIVDRPYSVENISSLELLGKYATSDSEREDYARRYLEAAADNTIKANMWALAINRVSVERDFMAEAVRKEPRFTSYLRSAGIDISGYRPRPPADPPVVSSDLFISLACGARCTQAFRRLHTNVKARAIARINVIFVGSELTDQEAIFDWARAQKIKKVELEESVVQLHVDSDHWVSRRQGDEVPQVVRRDG